MSLGDRINSFKAGMVIGEEAVKQEIDAIDWTTVEDICVEADEHERVVDTAIVVGAWWQVGKRFLRGD